MKMYNIHIRLKTFLTNGIVDICSLETNFCASIGGLQPQINEIVRRVLDGRVIRPVSDASKTEVVSVSCELDRIRCQEMEGLLELGLHPVKGVLLYGPPSSWMRKDSSCTSNIKNSRCSSPQNHCCSRVLGRRN
jgi:hypothetical protein